MKKLFFNVIGSLIFLVTFQLIHIQAQAQIWEENFNSYANGTTVGTGSRWTISSTSSNFKVMDGRFEAWNIGTGSYSDWFSETIDISGSSSVYASMQLMAAGGFEGSDVVAAQYSLDGGGWTTFENNGQQQDEFGYIDASTRVLTGSTLRIRVRTYNNNASETYFFDNVKIMSADSGVDLPCSVSEFAALYDFSTSAAGWSTPSGGYTYSTNDDAVYASNTGGTKTILSPVISVSASDVLTVSADVWSSGTLTAGDNIRFYYILNGSGVEVQFGSFTNGVTPTRLASANSITGATSIQIKIYANATSSARFYFFDNVGVKKQTPAIDLHFDISNVVTCNAPNATINTTGPNSSSYNYTWTSTNGTFTGSTNEDPVIPFQEGDFYVQVSDGTYTCKGAVYVFRDVSFPDLTITGGYINCSSPSTVLTANTATGTIFNWTGPSGFTSSIQSPTVTKEGVYKVEVSEPTTGCVNIASILVSGPDTEALWVENFTGLANGTKVDNGSTAWSIDVSNTQIPSSPANRYFEVQNEKFKMNYTVEQTDPFSDLAIWQSEVIDISGFSSVQAFVDLQSAGNLNSDSGNGLYDFINIYYRLNGGALTLFPSGFREGDVQPTTVTTGTIAGSTLQIVIESRTTATDEIYYIDNVSVYGIPPASNFDISSSSSVSGPITCADPSVTVSASSNDPGITWTWTGPAGFTSTNTNPATTNIPGSYHAEGVGSLTGCSTATDIIVVEDTTLPDASASNQTICSGGTTSVTITNPNSVPGTTFNWTVSATNVSGASNGSGNIIAQTLTSTDGINPGTVDYTITPTASSNGCSGAPIVITVTVNAPQTADANADLFNCNDGNFTMTANAPIAGTGSWSIVSGTATITAPSSEISTITGVPSGTSATLRWTISTPGCGTSSDDVVLTNYATPTTAAAGSDLNNCNSGNFTLSGNTPSAGTGLWSVVSGTATITTPGSASSAVTGVPVGTSATLRWTISNGVCTSSTDDVILTNYATPTTAAAGSDLNNCNNSNFTLSGNAPSAGTGLWSVVSGTATITTPGSATSTVTGVPVGTSATLRWTISNGVCTSSTDDIVLTNYATPTTAAAGSDLNNCNSGNFTLSGNTPSAGTGQWSVVSGTATITTPGSATSTVTGVPVGTSATLRWTISNGVCASSTDDIVLTNYATPTTSAAGSDLNNCNNSNFTLSGNTPSAGTGLWSVVSGTATITTPGSATSTVTGVPVGTSATLRWTISNGVCTSSTDDVILTNYATPTTAAAGSDLNNCSNSNFTLSGNTPSAGTGLWSVVSGTATITTPGSATSTVTGVPVGTSATLRWTISNGVCTSSTDDVILTNYATPTTAAAGSDLNNCSNSNFTLSGNTPSAGTGQWSVVSGTATITTPGSATSTVTGVPVGTSATLRWTISNGVCASSTDDIVLTNYATPTTAAAGSDLNNCNNSNFTLSGNTPSAGTGLWSVVSGTATITTPGSATSTVTGVPVGTSATLRWTISNGVCTSSTDDIVLTNYATPTTAAAGSDLNNCSNSNFTLSGNTPSAGTGQWSVVSGTATITTPGSATSTVTGVPVGTSATLRWTISNGVCTSSTDDIVLTNYATPTTAAAGSDLNNCNSGNFTLAGNTPSAGTGLWSVVSGTATITTPGSATSTVTGVPVGTSATLRWTISNGVCTASTDDVVLTNYATPTTSAAGSDLNNCNNSNFTLSGNTPSAGTGLWSVVSGTATITTPGSATSTVTGVPVGTSATLRWTISNGVCTPSTDDVVLTNYATPTTAAAGSDLNNCNNSNFTLSGNTPSAGTGLWSVVSGTATITTPGSASSAVTGVPVGTSATLRWTISNGVCTSSTDDVVLTNYATPTTAAAGSDLNNCNNSNFTLSGNTPSAGTGLWSVVSGTATITTPGSATSTVTGVPVGTSATLRWTISNGVCTPTTDDVVLINLAPTVTADAGTDLENCNDGNFTVSGNSPGPGSGVWSVVSGTATITTPGSATTTVTGIPAGTSATLRWTISSGTCTPSTDDVVLTNYATPTIATAGSDQDNCNNGSFTLNGNTPSAGVGAWSVVSGAATITTPGSPASTVTAVPAGTSVTLRWTISNGVCTPSTDDIVLTNYATPTTSAAGLDLNNCNSGNFALAGNTPSAGTGLWSVVSGTATITTPGTATSTVTGVPAGTSATLRWTISNGVCTPSTDDVILTNYATPTTAAAGSDLNNCNNSNFTLSGNTPSAGTGLWSVVSGTATITTPGSPTSTVTGVPAGTSATLRWTISNGVCTPSTDDVVVTNYATPTVADAGSDQDNCNSGSFTLAGNAPSAGAGLWSVVSGTATITTPGSATSAVTGVPVGTSATLRWTISNGACTPSSDDVVLTNYAAPTIATAGSDQDNCNNGNFTLAGNTPSSGTGVWSVVNGTATITVPGSSTSTVTGVPAGASATLRWTISNGVCTPSSNDVILTNYATPTVADAGSDQDNCNNGNFTLAGNTPSAGTGVWSVVSGTATITTPGSTTSTVTGVPAGTSATLRWTISNGVCTSSADDVVLTNYATPTVADAGADQDNCNNSNFSLTGNSPSAGTGVWSVISGTATITTPGSPASTVTGVPTGTSATLRWTISNGVCTASTDEVVLTNYETPTIADAGSDQDNCNSSSFTLSGNAPSIGTGVWSIVSGTATVTTPGSPSSGVTGVPVGTSATLRWTVSNGVCTSSTDDVVITNSALPTVADAGADQQQCNDGNFTLSANTPVVGTGNWTVVSGTATITNTALPSTTITGMPAGSSATLRWTISNGACSVSTDDVVLINDALPTTSAAGSDQDICGGATVLSANTPVIGSGSWNITSGAGGNIDNNTNPASPFNGIEGTTYILQWTITNGTCTSVDDVQIVLKAIPDVAANDDEICSGTNSSVIITNPNAVAGTQFDWVVQNSTNTTGMGGGTGSTINQTLTSTDGVSTGTVDYLITPAANGCAGTAVTATVVVNPVPVANAADETICDGGTTAIALNSSVGLSGVSYTWTTVQSGVSGANDEASGVGGPVAQMLTLTDSNIQGSVTYSISASFKGCTGPSVDAIATVDPALNLTASKSNDITCEFDEATIVASSTSTGISFAWNGPGGFSDSQAAPVINSAGMYIVSVTNGLAGCVAKDTVVVDENKIIPDVNVESIGFLEDASSTVQLVAVSSQPKVRFDWSGPEGFVSVIASPVTSIAGDFVVTVTDTLNGCANTASIEVRPRLMVSEGLSPNGDDVLDHWVIEGIENFPNNNVKVFNVWGDLVFEMRRYNNDENAWHGQVNSGLVAGSGNKAPDGTYYYVLDLGNNKQPLSGFVMIKR